MPKCSGIFFTFALDLESQLDKKMGKRFLRTELVTLVTFLSFVESNTPVWQLNRSDIMIPSMGDSMDGLSEIGERRSRVASTSSLAQVVHIVVVKMKKKDEKHVDAKFFD